MVIGVTGGVGTGKSTILEILQNEYQAQVIIADDIARELMMPGEVSYRAVAAYFGPSILTAGEGSEIDRGVLADIVFRDHDQLLELNKRTHPYVKIRIRELLEQYEREGCHMVVIETAILIQAGYLDMIDELWVVCTDYPVRVERLMSSRGYSREKIDTIIASQMPDQEMKAYADLVIDNSGDIDHARSQIRAHLMNREL